jgi:hypothetical protein
LYSAGLQARLRARAGTILIYNFFESRNCNGLERLFIYKKGTNIKIEKLNEREIKC